MELRFIIPELLVILVGASSSEDKSESTWFYTYNALDYEGMVIVIHISFYTPVLKKKNKNGRILAWRCPSVRKHSCTLHNSVIVQDIFMKFYRNTY